MRLFSWVFSLLRKLLLSVLSQHNLLRKEGKSLRVKKNTTRILLLYDFFSHGQSFSLVLVCPSLIKFRSAAFLIFSPSLIIIITQVTINFLAPLTTNTYCMKHFLWLGRLRHKVWFKCLAVELIKLELLCHQNWVLKSWAFTFLMIIL